MPGCRGTACLHGCLTIPCGRQASLASDSRRFHSMPRTYSFDYFKAEPTRSHRPKPGQKRKLKELKRPAPGEAKFHYGKEHAQTEELYQAHVMEAELERLADRDGALPRPPKEVEP